MFFEYVKMQKVACVRLWGCVCVIKSTQKMETQLALPTCGCTLLLIRNIQRCYKRRTL